MKKTIGWFWVLVAVFALLGGTKPGFTTETQRTQREEKPQVVANYGKLPLSFEANQGQTDKSVKFLSRGSGYGLYLTPTETVLTLRKPSGDDHAPVGAPLVGAQTHDPSGVGQPQGIAPTKLALPSPRGEGRGEGKHEENPKGNPPPFA
jgi:hypothetical protein